VKSIGVGVCGRARPGTPFFVDWEPETDDSLVRKQRRSRGAASGEIENKMKKLFGDC